MNNKPNIITPHAAVLIWNYSDRTNSDGSTSKVHDTDPAIIGTSSIISISTVKRKSNPIGSFEIKLAPRFNWVSRITPGSWCAILMSRESLPTMSQENLGRANESSLRMVGRIESVRGVVDVDPTTGARVTVFIITGVDWCSVFDTNFYIDYSSIHGLQGNSPAMSQTILGLQNFNLLLEKQSLLPASQLVSAIIDMWGRISDTVIVNAQKELNQQAREVQLSPIPLSSETQFKLPGAVAKYMGMGGLIGLESATNFATLIRQERGVLSSYDDPDKILLPGQLFSPYTESKESIGMINPGRFIGTHTFWQLLNSVSNSTLYELVADIRWDNGKPYFTLYHRIRPFVTRPTFLASSDDVDSKNPATAAAVLPLISNFSNVRRIKIPLEEVMTLNFGTNWRDRINFIELRPTLQSATNEMISQAKIYGTTVDTFGYQRDGFNPLFQDCEFSPLKFGSSGEVDVGELARWKHLLREWYFNAHLMLNGSITFVGQAKYIQVGDNIMVDSKVLGEAPTISGQKVFRNTYLTAHVENISHSFSVNPETGARSYSTTVQFVRGIITDGNGNLIPAISAVPETGAIDRYSSALSDKDERNKNVFGSSVESDPDAEKLNKDLPFGDKIL